MIPHQRPITERIGWLFELAQRHASEYASAEAWLARKRYRANHPTAIWVMKCMDGRINIPIATQTPKGIIQPFRNLGGMFRLGWPHLGETLVNDMEAVVNAGRQALVMVTYHYSKGDERRGCAGFHYRTQDAVAHTLEIRAEMGVLFGVHHHTVYPLVCGFETDEEALVIHGHLGATLSMAELTEADLDHLPQRLMALLPDMPTQMRHDLLPLLAGNLRHIARLRQMVRTLDIEHREWMLCVGRGFDWLHVPNIALIIGPYSPDLADPIRKAAGIIRANMRAGRIPSDGFLVMSSVPYEDIGVDRSRAMLKSNFMADFAAETVRKDFPDLAPLMTVRKTVLNWHSRQVEALEPPDGTKPPQTPSTSA